MELPRSLRGWGRASGALRVCREEIALYRNRHVWYTSPNRHSCLKSRIKIFFELFASQMKRGNFKVKSVIFLTINKLFIDWFCSKVLQLRLWGYSNIASTNYVILGPIFDFILKLSVWITFRMFFFFLSSWWTITTLTVNQNSPWL